MYQQDFDPAGSLGLSALVAFLPLLTLLILLGGFRMKAHWAGLVSLLVALAGAVFVYDMPVPQALDAGLLGSGVSVLIILWLTFNAIWIYNMTVHTGHFEVLRRSFASVSEDRRIQAIIIAFCFGALLEALAGGGSPIAICAVMLGVIGFDPLKAAAMALVANTAPVAFGGLGNPITVLATTTGLPAEDLGAMAGRQTPLLAMLVPFILVFMADGRRGLREAWAGALIGGVSFGVAQFVFANYVDYKLCDIFAALVAAAALILYSRFFLNSKSVGTTKAPAGQAHPDGESSEGGAAGGVTADGGAAVAVTATAEVVDTRRQQFLAFAPYAVIIAVFTLAQIPAIKDLLAEGTVVFAWPGLDIVSPSGEAVATNYTLNWASATGTLLMLSGLITAAVLRIGPAQAARIYVNTMRQFGWAIFTILCVFALSYVMNLSGQISTLGVWLAGAGGFFAFLSPIVGWFGVTITGTDAGSNALFGGLQAEVAQQLGAHPVLFGAANTSGGVMAKMISPQSLAVGTAAVGLVGAEGTLFRRVFGWSVLLLLLLCGIVYLQSTPVLDWMVVS
ncbi:L-lactate permease [Kineosporia sp. J2-2]|uniref:L-lactate permease n=1 Tax=Kineosporia corallincola TaxID=2835133 RepID=A0ABS5TK95_9ACTN|nr:L-lactate permease [Kineosporia corallincola]MBT0770004.1 L-lactate permease [Kineosporia corallincola]